MTKAITSQRTQTWRNFTKPRVIKRAASIGAGGEVGSDVTFEGAFSNLAHSFLSDKAPGLLPYELGFQLLERSDNDDRAVGVMGFKVGQQLIYAPVFFLSGELKGHELMYLKDSDSFVPLRENWVNYIVNRKPNIIGSAVGKDLRQLGVTRPSMDLARDPMRKHATEDWLQEGLPGLMYAIAPKTAATYSRSFVPVLPTLIKTSGAAALALLQLVDSYPRLAEPLVRCYGKGLFKTAMESAQTLQSAIPLRPTLAPRPVIITGSIIKEKTAAEIAYDTDPRRTGKLRIHTYEPGKTCEDITKEAAETLKRDGIYIEDARETASRIYKVQPPLQLQAPDKTDAYDVLVYPDKFEECIVLMNCHGPTGRRPGCVVVSKSGEDSKRSWCIAHPNNVLVAVKNTEDYAAWFDALPDAKELDRGGTYILVTEKGACTQPFVVENTMPSEGEERCYGVWWSHDYEMDACTPVLFGVVARREERDRADTRIESVSVGRIKGSKIQSLQKTMYMPPDTKALKLKQDDRPAPDSLSENNNVAPLRLGNNVDLQMGIYKISSELKVMNNGFEVIVNERHMSPTAAIIYLVGTHGLREKTARDLLFEATKNRGCRVRVKYAAPYDMLNSGPSAPAFPDMDPGQDNIFNSQMPMQQATEADVPIEMSQYGDPSEIYNAARPPDPQTMQQVQDAAGTGQQEVLDTSMLGALLRNSRDDTLIDRHLSDLIKGLDRIGRLLFNFYWHNDKFAERFGDSELPELEDALRNSFEGVGDLVLFLKQKAIDPYPGETTDVELGPQAEVI